jgi:phosphoglycolate phosphatase-like HAD superfamily hydrolase
VSSTHFDITVFDFDGTLVQSAEAKRQAFYDIFPADCAPSVASVLNAHPEASRYSIIPRIIAEAIRSEAALPATSVEQLVEAYALRAVAAVNAAPSMPAAENVIGALAKRMTIYVSSSTPQDQLEILLARRGWKIFFSGIFGYPCDKADTVALLLNRHAIPPSRLLVVGDGESDMRAAKQNGCAFFRITQPSDLSSVSAYAGLSYA